MRWIVSSGRALVATAVFAVFLAGAAFAQGVTSGAIAGRITDPQGEPVAQAAVQVTHRGTGFTTSSRTRENGQYLVQGLEVGGPYRVTIRAIGFQPFIRDNVDVKLSEATRVNAQLVAQAVELTAVEISAPATADFTPTRQGVAAQISDTLVQRIPTFSRDFIDQLKLAPQVVYAAGGAASGAGAYNRFNTITIDGANQSERFNLGSTGGVPGGSAGGKIVSLDAVKEFRVVFTPSDVRQGNFAGMLVNAVTKGGTNAFHGGGIYTMRSNDPVLGVDLVGEDLRASEFDVKQYGFHIGGPIIRDRLHFFVAPEWQQRVSPSTGPTTQVPADSLTRIATIMDTLYGFDVGSAGILDNETPLANLFGRIDFQVSPSNRLVFRQIYNRAEQDEFFRDNDFHTSDPLRQTQGFRFGSSGFSRAATNNSSVAQLYTNFSGGASNELIVGYSTIKDVRNVPVRAPEIDVGVAGRAVNFGTEQFSPGNLLEQDIFEVVNNFTIPMGAHTVTVGGRLDHTHIFNNFAQGSFGVYKFASTDALLAGTPEGYAVGYPNSGRPEDIPADFRVRVFSLYAQDQWSVSDRLTVTAGLRADIPSLLDKPPQNDTLTVALAAEGLPGVRTDATPQTSVLFSPRIGVNFDPTGDQRNQIRGTLGLYAGPPPYILLGNAYANTGLGLVRLQCRGPSTPAFTLNVDSLPTACAGEPAPGPGEAGTLGVNLTDPDFKYPQYFGLSLGFDRQLPGGIVLTVEGIYRKAVNGVLIRDAALRGPRMLGGIPYADRDGRVLYADTIIANGSVPFNGTFRNQRWLDSLRGVAFTEGMIEVTNQSKDYNYSISAQLNRRFSDHFEATVAYTYLQSKDVQSLTSDRAISNWRFGRQLSTAHENLQATTSNFERPHRFLAYGTYTPPWAGGLTDITLYYEAISGVPIVYVTNGDLNGDLVSGNDPIYVPRNATDPSEIQIGTGTGTSFVQNTAAAQAFERFISAQPCLDRQRGRIMARNSCRTPSQHRFDLSIRQAIPQFGQHRLALQIDIFNVLNILNKEWGQIRLPTDQAFNNNQTALTVRGRNPGPLSQSISTFEFNDDLYEAGSGAPLPFEGRTTSSYNIQLTLRYSF